MKPHNVLCFCGVKKYEWNAVLSTHFGPGVYYFFSYCTFFFLRKTIILYSGMPNHTVSKDGGLKMSIIQHYYPEYMILYL